MKPIHLLIVFSAFLFSLSAYQIWKALNSKDYQIQDSTLSGFADTGKGYIPADELREKFRSKIADLQEDAKGYKLYWLILSFLVTSLTGISTLISSLKASQAAATPQRSTLILLAILTFCSTLANWGDSKLSESRTEVVDRLQKVKDLRNAFLVTYDKQADGNAPALDRLIQAYEDQLEEL